MPTTKTAKTSEIKLRRRHGQIIAILPSGSRKGVFHVLHINEADKSTHCTCEAYRFNGTCYHCDAADLLIQEMGPRKVRKGKRAEPKAVIDAYDPFSDLEEINIQARETQESEAELTAGDLEAIRRFEEEEAWAAYRQEQVIRFHAQEVA